MKHTHNIYAIPCKSGFYKTVKCVTSETHSDPPGNKPVNTFMDWANALWEFKRTWMGFTPIHKRFPVVVAKIYE